VQEFFHGIPDDKEYHEQKIADLKNNIGAYRFTVDTGRKYHKVMMTTDGGNRVVFTASLTRRLVKYTKQHLSKHLLRECVLIFVSSQSVNLLENADWAGGYLYQERIISG